MLPVAVYANIINNMNPSDNNGYKPENQNNQPNPNVFPQNQSSEGGIEGRGQASIPFDVVEGNKNNPPIPNEPNSDIPTIPPIPTPTNNPGDNNGVTTPTPPEPIIGSVEYLNYIAPDSAKNGSQIKKVDNKLFIGAGIAVAALIVVCAVIGALGSGRNNIPIAQQLSLDIANLDKVIEYGNSNDDYSSSVSNARAEINAVMLTQKKKISDVVSVQNKKDKKSKKGKDVEPDESIEESLDKAKAQGNLDKAYSQALKKGLDAIKSTTEKYYESTSSEKQTILKPFYGETSELLSRIESVINYQ